MQKLPERRAKQSSFPANDFEVKAYNLQQFSNSLNLFSLKWPFLENEDHFNFVLLTVERSVETCFHLSHLKINGSKVFGLQFGFRAQSYAWEHFINWNNFRSPILAPDLT